MPTNVTPEYKEAEEAFRAARESPERLACLKEMLRTIPKHKGTEHLQADIKSRIKLLSEELAGPKKRAGRTGPSHVVRPEGAAQLALIGPPNAGKSTLHARLTGSRTEVGPYPFTTKSPIPGMLPFEDVHFQLVDLPPVSADYMETWFVNALQPADAALLVIDLSDPECVEHVSAIRVRLEEKKISLRESLPGLSFEHGAVTPRKEADDEDFSDPFHLHLPTVLIANKSDLDPNPEEVQILEELLGVRFPALAASAKTGWGLDALGALLFKGLEILRVYTKAPGKQAEMDRPFTLRSGATIADAARLVHKDIARSLKYARLWGSGQFDGQQVGADHHLADRDIIELHMR